MKLLDRSLLLSVALGLHSVGIAQSTTGPSKFALLIGISTYSHPTASITVPSGTPRTGRYEPAIDFEDLAGPPNDVQAMRQLLVDKFHFPTDTEHMIVLPEEQATHDGLLKALQRVLVDAPRKGDTVVLYVSAHGSLRPYPKGQGSGEFFNLLDDSNDQRHVENTLVPYDWNTGVDDIFSRDLRHYFQLAVDKGIHVTAIFDSCHSGDLGRAVLKGKLISRDFVFDPREMPPDPYAKESRPTLPQNDPLNPVLILSAAQKDQLALDDGTSDPAHGVFTSALIEALRALPEDHPVSDVFSRLQVSMELAPNSIHQQPEIDTTADRMRQPLFDGATVNGPATAAVVNVDKNGVLLDIGIVADVGPGSIFTTMPVGSEPAVLLKVIKSEGLGRSIAQPIAPGGSVHPREIVQLKQAVPWQRPDLLLYAGTANPQRANVQAAVSAITTSGITLVADPSLNPWAYHLFWAENHWTLTAHTHRNDGAHQKPEAPVNLGDALGAKSLSRIPPGSTVWFDPPLPQEMVQGLFQPPAKGVPPIAAQLTPDRSKAMYVIAARLQDKTIEYAWFKRSDVDAEVQTPAWMGPGCSPGSGYPLHTEWVDSTSTEATSAALNKYARDLARLNGWFHLSSSPLSQQSPFPYTLALHPAQGGEDITQGGTTVADSYDLYLVGNPTPKTIPQWVYVMSLDCQGKSNVTWPYDVGPDAPPGTVSQPPKMFPIDDANRLATRIRLPGDPFPVDGPFGTDTYILLVTSTRLSDYHALEFGPVVSRGVLDNPLEGLLDDTSSGNRDASGPIPTKWGIWSMQVQSRPNTTTAPEHQ